VNHGGERTYREQDLASVARDIIDSNAYMTLATADENGRPWASPVWYAAEGYARFYWVSSPEARHSRNLAARPEVGVVIFDSQAPVGTGQGVYMSATAEELAGTELDRDIGVFSRRSQAHGAGGWTREDVTPPARHRLYRATASEHYVLDDKDRRTLVSV
jgi:nitroimidazol reductase NimA-like FMN-containing flavoprotein (pyridoxamine 5'-phosphate oxidase superfamily)